MAEEMIIITHWSSRFCCCGESGGKECRVREAKEAAGSGKGFQRGEDDDDAGHDYAR